MSERTVDLWGEQEDGSNTMSRAIERAYWKKEMVWQRLGSFLHQRSDEPFYFLSRGRKIFDIASLIALVVAAVFCSFTQYNAGVQRETDFNAEFSHIVFNQTAKEIRDQLKSSSGIDKLREVYGAESVTKLQDIITCVKDRNKEGNKQQIILTTVVLTGWALSFLVHFTIYLISSIKFQRIFPRRKLGFKWKRQLPDQTPPTVRIPYSPVSLAPTVRALRKMVKDVKEGTVPVSAPTKFLLSANGRQFLNRACKRFNDKVQLFDNEMVRINRRGTFSFYLITLVCVSLGMTAAYEDSSATDKCRFRVLLLAFMEKFSFTLLAAFALASFAGVSQYSQLTCVREKLCRLTDDEKFLISLIAANSNEPFTGVARSESSGYAHIETPGDTEIFVPMHASLFAYKQARTLDNTSPMRLYNHNAPDNFANYEMT